MGKMYNILIMVFVVELALYLFAGTTYANTSLFNLLFNPIGYLSNTLWVKIVAVLSIAGAAGIIVGTIFSSRIEFGVFLTMCAVLITFALPLVNLWRFINGQLVGIFSSVIASDIITLLVVAPLFLYYIVTVIEWARSNQ